MSKTKKHLFRRQKVNGINSGYIRCLSNAPGSTPSMFALSGLPAEGGTQTINVGLTGVIKCQIIANDGAIWSTIAQYFKP